MSISDRDRQLRSSKLVRAVRTTGVVVYGVLAGTIVFACGGFLILLISGSIVDMIGVVPRGEIVFDLLVATLVVSIACGTLWGALRARKQFRIDNQNSLTDRTKEETVLCDNCGSARLGKWCSVCGQNDREYRRLVPVLSEVVGEMFEADSRVWRTLRILLSKPGLLSLEFARNRRAYYLSPFRLYLFTSLLYFLLMSLFAGSAETDDSGSLFSSSVFYEYLPINILVALPLYALLLQFVFAGQRGYAEHFVFVLHFQTIGFFILMFFIPWIVLADDLWQFFGFSAYFLPTSVYLFLAIKRFYSTSCLARAPGWLATLSIYIVLFCTVVIGTHAITDLLS
ncbi:MAG: DUF3667 domain-containing protein [Gammaproteobacteria bacterium]|nr:DUF3667 domain-containing protein [Gammaproteobacteria bacterium]MYF01674.1 DUF3667 domain-containing protein [Gammaproteobacteria bacterium]MYI76805.1 DUF3667 domain-containing protein [Gammaproteobacteria bacterium]